MYIKKLTATFGCLDNESLPLAPGLNVIQAPNEGGKSTWTAFLRVMLYGLNTRDRSPLADKRRYLPWNGFPMQGTMDLSCRAGDITITRTSSRINSPMGAFSAVYSGTATPVRGLTASNFGEQLLGIPQDVYERSAYIRQSSIAMDQSAALERRIAALITTGEEDTSYAAAADRLKKQLHRRRYNKTGLLPQLEQELTALQATHREAASLQEQLQRSRERETGLLQLQQELQEQIALHDAAAAARRAQEALAADQAYREALHRQTLLEEQAAVLPPREALEALAAGGELLEASQQSIPAFHEKAAAAKERLLQAERVLAAHPFGGLTPAQAQQLPLCEKSSPALSLRILSALALMGTLACTLLLYLSAGTAAALTGGIAVSALSLFALLICWQSRKKQELRRSQLLRERQALLAEHAALYDAVQAARAASLGADAAREAAESAYAAQRRRFFAQAAALQPQPEDLSAARRAVAGALELHRALDAARQQAEHARLHRDMLSRGAPPMPPHRPTPPDTPRPQLESRLSDIQEELRTLRQHAHTLRGRIQSLGEPARLRSRQELVEERLRRTQDEYDAIALAADTLSAANAELQSRFSPALGEMSANFFTKLTQEKYNKVLLDRSMSPSAQEAAQFIPRESALLSQGTADQLYLAVRLAICRLVLPAEDPAPIVLDDALVTFDDSRCRSALDLLAELSQTRQILLFTCQGRELAYLERAHPGRFSAVRPQPS